MKSNKKNTKEQPIRNINKKCNQEMLTLLDLDKAQLMERNYYICS